MEQRLHVAEDIHKASTLPADFYKDPSIYEASKDAIFAKSWQFVGDSDMVKVPGSVLPLTMLEGCLDEPIVITRASDDRLHCLSNVCTHRGMLVAESPGNERYLRCRYHGRRFGLDGCFQHMPEFDGVEGFPSERDHLPKVPFGMWSKLIFASIRPDLPMEDVLRPMTSRLGWLPLHEFRFDHARSRDYLVQANWALYVDNYLEGFHIPFIHAGLNETLDYENYTTHQYDRANLQLAVSKGADGVFDLPESSPEFGQRISAYYYWIFPNLMFNFYPWGLSINVLRPMGPSLTKVSFLCYVWREDKMGVGAGSALDRVEREDEVVVEAVQRGVRSRLYDKGRFSVKREANVHQFHRLVSAALQGV